MSKIKNGWLDQYGAQPFEQHHFRTAGAQGVKMLQEKNTGRATGLVFSGRLVQSALASDSIKSPTETASHA